jgi:glycosyltransferase involved in cell wall biosynthesis
LYLLQAWKQLALPEARLLIRCAGGLEGYPVLQALVSGMPNVELVPYQDDMAGFYRRCHLFVLPSVDDGFGMALLEAMAQGVPSIATSACGASELLRNGVDSLIVEPGSETALAEAILCLYRSEELRRSIGAAGAQTCNRLAAGNAYASIIRETVHKLAPA